MANSDMQDAGSAPRFTKSDVLSIELKSEEFEVPGYGKTVVIQALNAAQKAAYDESMYEVEADAEGNVKTRARMAGRHIKLASLGLREPAMTEEELGQRPSGFVQPIAERIREISGMNVTVEDAEGN